MHIPVVWYLNGHIRAFVLIDLLEPDNPEGAMILEWSKIPLHLWHRSFILLSWILIFEARGITEMPWCVLVFCKTESCSSKGFNCKILCSFIWIIFILNLQHSSQFQLEVKDLAVTIFTIFFSLLCWSFDHLIFLNCMFALHFWVFENDHWNSYSDLLKGSLVLLLWYFKNDLYCSFLLRLFDFLDFADVTDIWSSEVIRFCFKSPF